MQNKELHQIKNRLRKHLEKLQKEYYIKRIGIFGSFANKLQNPKSDIDILVSFSKPVGFFHFIHTGDYLKQILKRKVDLVTPSALKPEIKHIVLNTVKYI